MATLLERYLANDPEVVDCYCGPVASLFESTPASRPWDPDLIEAIREYNASMGHHPAFDGDEAVVITGQQPAIFAGPLYSVYKAITTIQLAKELSEKSGARVVPIFWVGSEDHDFDEAATVYFPTRKNTTEKLTLPMRPEYEGKALNQIPVTEDIGLLIDTLVEHAPGGEFRGEIESFMRDSAAASTSIADWSTRILARFFRDTPLIFFAPHLSAARRASAPMMKKAIEHPLAVTKAVNAGAARMTALGYAAQVEKNDTECGFFHEVDSVRAKVTHEQGLFQLPDLKKSLSQDELLTELNLHPEHFSPNVALRCVVQQHLFPVAAYVAGPGELAYWGQFKSVFEAFEAPMPTVYPRIQAMLTTTKLNKFRRKYGIAYQDLFLPQQDLLTHALSTIDTSPAIGMVANARAEIADRLQALSTGLTDTAPVAADMAKNLSADLIRKFARLEQNVLYADESRREVVESHVLRVQSMLAPNRKPQERMHTVVPYIFEHGWGLCDRLMRELTLENQDVQEVEL